MEISQSITNEKNDQVEAPLQRGFCIEEVAIIGKFWEIKASAEGDNAELLLYGDIGDFRFFGEDLCDVSAKRIARELKDLGPVAEIAVRINSPGGSVSTAQAICSMLQRHDAKITVYVDGIAASAASMVAMAGDEIIMPEHSMMMIHSPLAYLGNCNAAEMRKIADTLEKVQVSMIALYKRSGQSEEEIRSLLEAETWLTAREAVDLGFADKVEGSLEIAAKLEGNTAILACGKRTLQFDASRYRNVPGFFVPAAKSEPKEEPRVPEEEDPGESKEKEEEIIVDLAELKAKHPEIFKAAAEEGAQGERERIRAIEDLGAVASGDLGKAAKFENPCSPEVFARRVLERQKQQGATARGNLMADAGDLPQIGGGDAPKGSPENTESKAEEEEAFCAAFGAGFGGRK